VILATVVFGRAWCGWICPLERCSIYFAETLAREAPPAPGRLAQGQYGLLMTILVAAVLGNLTLLVSIH